MLVKERERNWILINTIVTTGIWSFWNEEELDIVGAYRIGHGKSIIENLGETGFYTSTLFDYNEVFKYDYLPDSIELGRSFVQKKYWNSKALNYLWRGIGSYLINYPGVKIFVRRSEYKQQLPESR